MHRATWTLATALTLLASSARGEDERIAYHAEGRCPAAYEAAFVLEARAPGVKLVGDGESAQARLSVGAAPEGYRGELAFDDGGQTTTRAVTARHCRDVIDALAFVYAVARAERAPSAAPAVIAATREEPAPPVSVTIGAPRPRDEASSPRADAPSLLHGALGARGGVMSGVGPALAPRGELFFELGFDRAGPWVPALRLGGAFAASSGARAEGAASFTLWAATAELHVARIGGREGRMRLTPLLRAQVGDMFAESSGLADARREHAPWATVGAGASARWSLTPALDLELSGGLDVSLSRPRFYFEPQATVHEVAALGGSFAAGVVLPIW